MCLRRHIAILHLFSPRFTVPADASRILLIHRFVVVCVLVVVFCLFGVFGVWFFFFGVYIYVYGLLLEYFRSWTGTFYLFLCCGIL